MNVEVIKITNPKELEHAFEIRRKVFEIEQNVSREEEFDENENTSIHFLASVDTVPAGTARWRITKDGIKLERFAVLQEFRNRKVGSQVLKKVLEDVIPLNKKIYLNAQLRAIPFYEREGFVTEGEIFTEANILHKKMVLSPAVAVFSSAEVL